MPTPPTLEQSLRVVVREWADATREYRALTRATLPDLDAQIDALDVIDSATARLLAFDEALKTTEGTK